MHLVGCLIFFFFGIFFVILALFGNVLRVLFGLRKASKKFQQATQQSQREEKRDKKETKHHNENREKGKIFSKNEGEYVDFEEIK